MSTPAVDARQHSLDETPARQHTPARPPPSRSPSGGPLASTSASQRSMSGSTSGGPSTAASHLTLEAALAGANGSHAAALDTVLAERNMLSSQNAQLWKLIEKQRASYANAMKDLERIRGERDKAIARLDGSRGPRRQHSTPQKSSSASALPSSSRDSPSAESASVHTTPKPASDPPSTNGAPPAQADSTRSSPNLDDAASVVAYSIAEQPEPEPESATPAVKQPPSIITTFPTTPSRHPASAEAVSATPVNAADPTRPLHIATKKHSLDSHTGPSAGSPSTQTHISASNMLMPGNDSKRAKRESRISIPPEARNYIQHMDDLPSPNHSMSNLSNVSSSSVNVSTSSLNGYGKESLSPVAENPRQRAVSSPERPLEGTRSQSTTPPFLDMDNSEDEDDAVPSAPSTTTAPIPIGQPRQAPTYATSSTTSPEPAPSFTFSDDTRGPSASSSTSPADDYAPGRSQQSFAQQQQTSAPRQQQFDLSTPPNSPPVTQTSASTSSSRAGMFRAQRLIHSDLAQTNVRISGSNIRANDRGKEVLSFVIAIAPGNKERYKIEKLYGDVLALDGRVRAAMSRSQLKALAPLPDAKLFKDHAPAKVDARKVALEKYLQALVRAPMKNTDDLCAFLSSDIVRDTKAPVMQSGHKEGYLTKRGKNFGGWKTRFFVLQNSTLEYYESRGGTHLGSIVITGAQIGRQQRPQQSRADDDDNEFRHAFLIIEAKRGPGGQSPRHVLCAESDTERDAWVEVLVRYVTGAYDESSSGGQSSSVSSNTAVPRSSTSSYDSNSVKRPRMSKDEISKGSAVPISQLQIDQHNQKLFQSAPSISEAGSPVGTSPDKSPAHAHSQDSLARKMLDRSGSHPHNGSEISLSNSVPSYLDVAGHPSQRPHPHQGALTPRSASELGHYPDLKGPPPQGYGQSGHHNIERPNSQPSRSTQQQRASYHPSLSTVHSSPTSERPPQGERAVSPDLLTPRAEQSRPEPPRQAPAPGPEQPRTTKISGPMNGKPIPAGYNFGGSLNQVPTQPPAPAPEGLAPPSSDRKGKVASRFWQFGRGDKNPVAAPVPTQMPRAVFGVTLEDSLAVAQIAKLPAIVFRCIQYLEAKRADQEEGIYRLSGSSAVIKNLRDRFNAEGDVDLLASDEFWDPHAIAGLLKSFLRDLPASILTRDLHLRFLHVIDLMDPQERVSELQSLISMLPLANYSLLRALTAHLILVVQNSNVNKMTMRNVGIVFSPTLGIPAGVFSLMLGEFNRVFSVEPDQRPEEVEENPADPAAAAASQLSRRNSRHYADAAADQMLGLTGRSLGADADESDDGDELLSVHEESGAETENEADVTLTLESQSSAGGDAESYHTHQSHQHGPPPQVFVDQHPGHGRPEVFK
ncbi:RhoGAP-domain-containing protein [Auricularia subglabra TFB-10046 SS5]|nr:RhoGAP-domain-containing protein [Auricularia subglabra TFB-10046 SS5]